MSYQLIETLHTLGTPRILVLGDVMLDRYVWGDAERISQEAPVILLRADREEDRLGGAANVAHMLRGLEADVTMAGVIGDDADGRALIETLKRDDVDCELLISDRKRPTTVKERFIGRAQHRHPHQILRVDRESRASIDSAMVEQLTQRITAVLPEHQAVLISDYGKGVCTPELIQNVIAAARRQNVPVVIDPCRGHDYGRYRGATAITPNRLETSLASEIDVTTIDAAIAAGRKLCESLSLDCIFVTVDSDGMVLVSATGEAEHFPTRKRQVYDITGAGDMVLAAIGVGMGAGVPVDQICRLANVAGGLEVEQVGVVPITRDEMLADLLRGERPSSEKIVSLEMARRHITARRKLGQKIVLTNGCFDLMHAGHVHYLEQASQEGDCLVVALNSDAGIRQLDKGSDRPICSQEQRALLLSALQAVAYVVIFDEATPHRVIEALAPDKLVKGGTYQPHEVVGGDIVTAYGGEVKVLGLVPELSTTKLVERIRRTDPAGQSSGEPLPAIDFTRKAG
ncbi:MAG: bifunctional heptose 7-phosphate kinase/heptose 1-phosphate adenyltransferase [Planctomycetota bacterium]|nr:bifunctional heptose 7-phosphate kinase/heptose 1-phosphate adenyltransferase [Planctomycetota bacterium]MDA1213338.1 bifunctional heptose 7-phosphate kinase/heptose 1-phosphate adenyltransferase [Planctomycetota bacterium]